MNLDAKIESLLFFKGEPVSIKDIVRILSVPETAVKEAIEVLKSRQANTGLTLLENNSEISLGTNKEASDFLESLRKEELSKDLTKSALETLSIILYKGTVTRSEIDYIRGVNSSFILRNLLIRGLVEKNIDAKNSRRYTYSPTIETLQYMGITNLSDLPDYANVIKELDSTLENSQNSGNE